MKSSMYINYPSDLPYYNEKATNVLIDIDCWLRLPTWFLLRIVIDTDNLNSDIQMDISL